MSAGPGIVDFYAELEVASSADANAIKKSYRQLVLKYHPDKNPEDRESAEDKIRRINNAYETLSVPAKRAAYDAQARSMLTKANGIRVDTSMIQPRMAIPKSFMLCPIGHPDKFVRAVGRSLSVHSRVDVPDIEFDQFFQAARFSLWWLPEYNNMCRLRLQPIIFSGVVAQTELKKAVKFDFAAGSFISFGLSMQTTSSDVMLCETEEPTCTNVIAETSPDYPGAFRFDAAYFRGHYFSFDPPCHTGMIRHGTNQFAVRDFMLMDFSVAEQFRTLDEVLTPVVIELGGDKRPVKLTGVCQHATVQNYFKTVMAGNFWDFSDFATYFQAHSDKWDHDANQQMLRLRGVEDNLGRALKRAKTASDSITVLLKASNQNHEICWLDVDSMEHGLRMLSSPKVVDSERRRCKDAQKFLLSILKQMCSSNGNISLSDLSALWDSLISFGGSKPDHDIQKLRTEVVDSAGERATTIMCERDVTVDYELLCFLLEMPVSWERCAKFVSQKGQQAIAKQPLDKLVPLIRNAAKAKAGEFGECLATSAMMKVFGAEANLAVEALDAMVSGGFGLEGVPMMLRMFMPRVSSECSARVVAGLAEHGAKGTDYDACWEAAFGESSFASLPADLQKRLKAQQTAQENRSRSRSRGSKK